MHSLMDMNNQGLNALVFGATGAIGTVIIKIFKELVISLLRSKQWTKVYVVVRR